MSAPTAGFLDPQALATLDGTAFRATRPYPWCNPAGVLRAEAFAALVAAAPTLALFEGSFGHARAHGQTPHDRHVLEYAPALPVAPEWHAFAAELQGPAYRAFLARMLGTSRFRLRFHWHYTPAGCSVSPHCDNKAKLGSHLFYLNTDADWRPEWGGETVILDDGGRFRRASAPRFEDFTSAVAGETLGNRSLLFVRRGNSWHGVREITCPPGALRKVFIVVIEALRLRDRLRQPWRRAA